MLSSEAHATIETFRDLTLAHPKLLAVDREVRSFVHEPADTGVLLIAGPTGVGKSTLKRKVVGTLAAEFASHPIYAPDGRRIGAPMQFDTPAAAGGNFSWTEYYIAGLEGVDHPAPQAIVHVPEDPRAPIVKGRPRSVGDLRRTFITAVRHALPAAIAEDEAQHLGAVGDGARLVAQLEMIKSQADETGRPFLLFGTYDLLRLRNLSGQLGRRCREINFARYDIRATADWKSFCAVLRSFAAHLPIDDATVLDNAEWIYVRTAGCVGTLKQWLTRSLVDALETGDREIGIESLERTALPVATLTAIAEEIELGERQLSEGADDLRALEELLGLTAAIAPKAKRAPRRRPGRRLPTRDAVPALA